jgi:hypothetical protein
VRASTSFVLALARCGRHVDPRRDPALTGTQPGTRHEPTAPGKAGGAKHLGRVKDHPRPIRQGSSEARHARHASQACQACNL